MGKSRGWRLRWEEDSRENGNVRSKLRGLSDMKRPERATRLTRRDLFQTSVVVAGAVAVARWGGALAFPRMAEAQAPYFQSSNNIVFVDKCRSLQNLTLSLQATRDLITLGNNGFSLQLNCYPQTHPQSTHRGKPLIWAQYVIAVQNNSVQWGIQYFSTPKGFGFSPSPNYVSFASAPSNRVPAGSVMKIALDTKANGTVTTAKFSITGSKGKVSSHTFTFPSHVLYAIYGFQVNLVGPPSGTHTCKFTSADGFLNYSVSSGTLAVPAGRLPVLPGAQGKNTCGGPQPITAETSNVYYAQPLTASSNPMGQEFGLAVHSPRPPKLSK